MTNPTIPENGLDVSALKPCPFCGSPGQFHPAVAQSSGAYVECINEKCGASLFGSSYVSSDEAIAAWNRRLPPADNAVAVKALEWTKHPANELWRSHSLLGIHKVYAVKHIAWVYESYDGTEASGKADTVDDAKSSAQQDYTNRILSAITATPSYAEGRAAILHDAAKAGADAIRVNHPILAGAVERAIEALIGAAL